MREEDTVLHKISLAPCPFFTQVPHHGDSFHPRGVFMKRTTFALGAAALLSLGAITAPAHAQPGFPPRVVVTPAPPPPPHGYVVAPGYYPGYPGYSPSFGHPAPGWQGRDGRWDDRRRGWGDRDHDGVPDRYDRDRDGDGVPNRFDRRPDNPYRY
jgi:hypothetical protein